MIFLVFERCEVAGKRSQMISGCVGDACDAHARVSELSERKNPPKFTENQEPESTPYTAALLNDVRYSVTVMILEVFHVILDLYENGGFRF